jgi:exodeoxyribonuclease V alpha subunit
VLCLTRVSAGQTSVAAVNAAMHRLFQRASTEGTRDPLVSAAAFIPGEPVLITRNDHRRDLVNGDLGVILRGSNDDQREDALHVAFARPRSPQGLLFYPLDELREQLTLAFALTVHKAQGSEYDHVALVLPRHDIPLLTREILYTAGEAERGGDR